LKGIYYLYMLCLLS